MLLILGLLALSLPATAEMYKWVDAQGSVHFTDNLFNVPQEYLAQIKTYEEQESTLSAASTGSGIVSSAIKTDPSVPQI